MKAGKQISWLILFSVAMGFLEAAVVIYLRQLYYPEGFAFPLKIMDAHIALVEWLREAATVVMLAGIGFLAGRTPNQRLAFFLAAFSIWDIFYYIFLKLLIHWPDSLFTWDILFLIPVPWIGPVLAPCIVSLTMILLAVALWLRDRAGINSQLNYAEWAILLAGSLAVIASWTWDYFRASGGVKSPDEALRVIATYIPVHYSWWTFSAGEVLLLVGIVVFWRRTQSLQAS